MSRLVLLAAVTLAGLTLAPAAAAPAASTPALPGEVLAIGLDNPRGIALGKGGTVYVAEAGKGGTGPCLDRAGGGRACLGATGAVAAVKKRKVKRILTGLPSLAGADGMSAVGPADVARRGDRIFTITGLDAPASSRAALGELGGRLGWLFEARDGTASPVADLAGLGRDGVSNPFGLTYMRRQLYVADAGARRVVVVKDDGTPREKAAMSEAPSAIGNAGKRRLYVAERTTAPFPKAGARVFRVPGGETPPKVFATKFTNIVDIVPAGFGSLYVLEGSQGPGTGRASGRVIHMEPGGVVRHILATGLPAPGGMEVDPLTGKIYVTLNADRPTDGALVRLKGHGSHASVGTPQGYYPDMVKATKRGIAEARTLLRKTKAQAHRWQFARARKAGFRFTASNPPSVPKVFHLRRDRFDSDGKEMDPRRPESLVYYNDKHGKKTLLAIMYRVETQSFPAITRGLLGWHRHGTSTKALPMTHVWLTNDIRSAMANCLPVKELEAALGWKYEGHSGGTSGLESLPCLPPDRRPPSR